MSFILGGWNIGVVTGGMPQKVATAFGNLTEQLIGCEYTPIAYLGSQQVNGTNHAVLAEQTVLTGKDTKNIVVIIFNEKPHEMEATLVSIERVIEGGDGMGAIKIAATTDIPAEAQSVFDEAFAGFVGSGVKPFALLATQVVNGIDYIFAAEVTSVTKEPVTSVAIVTVNSNSKQASFDDLLKGSVSAKTLGYAFTWLKGNNSLKAANGPVGAWNVNVALGSMPEEVATGFGKLSDLVGATYEPIAYLGSQVVNGVNHAVLAEQTLVLENPVKNVVLVVLNQKPGSMDAEVVSIKTLVEGGNGFGATQVNVEKGDGIDKTAQRIFDQRFGGFVGTVVKPFALLATQVVRGTNYVFACESTPVIVDGDDVKKAVLVIMNDLSEEVQFIDILQPEINRSLGAPLGEWP